MPDTNEPGEYDINDMARMFADYRRAPRDIVPPTPSDEPIPTGPQTVTYYEMTESGVTATTETITLGPAIYPKEKDQ